MAHLSRSSHITVVVIGLDQGALLGSKRLLIGAAIPAVQWQKLQSSQGPACTPDGPARCHPRMLRYVEEVQGAPRVVAIGQLASRDAVPGFELDETGGRSTR